MITPKSVVWVRRMTGQTRDLTGECDGERQPDRGYTEMTLTVPSSYKGEILRVLTLHASGTDVELITQVQQLEILRYSLARTPGAHSSTVAVLAGSLDRPGLASACSAATWRPRPCRLTTLTAATNARSCRRQRADLRCGTTRLGRAMR